jgi:broad specificity phosphatase PhoE
MRLLAALLLALLPSLAHAQPPAAPDVYVVRHLNTPAGERDPDLVPEGVRVAALLPAWFERERARPVAIYVSDYKRTRQTAGPLAERLGLQLTIYDPSDTPALIARVRAEAGPVLIVGHSNTVPDIVAALGGTRPAPLVHEDFGDIWRVRPGGATERMRIEPR